MSEDINAKLCSDLIHAESEDEVIRLLEAAGYWDKPELWRHYGDVENNWGQSGNQQSLAEAALAEKIVNSVDARLINECRERGIDPTEASAPQSVRSAVSQFFENGTGEKLAIGGYIEEWPDPKIREVADGITLTATGERPKQLNITIADCGEGQTPDRLPDTILSLGKSNKLRVPFVQGKFNQGGTGALSFCGSKNLQLVISKRNPKLLDRDAQGRDLEWGFTVVRREFPTGEPGAPQSSIYTYLAPVGVRTNRRDRHGEVLSFGRSSSFPIYPNDEAPFGREATFGTAIKMFDYRFVGDRSNILRGKSLLSRLDLLLPEVALPVRFFEYRTNAAGKYLDVGSRRTSMAGLLRRIRDSANVVDGFPIKLPFQVEGEKLLANVFAFVPEGTSRDTNDDADGKTKKLGGLKGYRKNEGIVFLRNGQTQGSLPKDFFRRDAVKMKPLADDLLVFVDCDNLSPIVRENLFMTSRDRLRDGDFRQALISTLENTLRDCPELKELRNKRQQERLSARLEDDKPLTDVLQALIKTSPNLTTLLQLGQRISAPFNTRAAGSNDEEPFRGEVYPTFFKSKGVEYGKPLARACPIDTRMRLTFETDARNDYFTRVVERGTFDLVWLSGDGTEYKA